MNKNEYSEIYAILCMLGNSYIMKLPNIIVKEIVTNRNYDYCPEYFLSDFQENSNIYISDNAINYINELFSKYWINN